jgi:signal transduction histidine kinase
VADTAVLPNTRTLEDARWVLVGACWFLAAIFGQVIRYQRYATPLEKQQMKWVLFGFSLTIIFSLVTSLLLISFPGLTHSPDNEAGLVVILGGVYLLTALIFPITIALSILRYRLWDVDILLNRTLVYGGLSLAIVVVHILFVGGVGTLAIGGQSRLATFVVATMIIVVGLRPMRRWLQNRVDSIITPQEGVSPLNPQSHRVETDEPHEQAKAPVEERSVPLPFNHKAMLIIPWVLVVAAFLAVYAIDLGLSYRMIVSPCQGQDCHYQAITAAEAQVLAGIGLPVQAYALYMLGITVMTVAVFAILGLWILARLYPQRLGLLFSLMLIIIPVTAITSFDVVAAAYPSWAVPIQLLFGFGQLLLLSFFLVFPNGRFAPRWTILVPPIVAIVGLASTFNNDLLGPQFIVIYFFLLSAIFAGVVYRYRRHFNQTERQQMKWVLLGMLIFLLGIPIWGYTFEFSSPLPGQERLLTIIGGWTLAQIVMLALPFTIVIAILYNRLWDVDALINRTLVYGGLSLGIVVVYMLAVGTLGTLFQSQGSFLFALLATGLIAVLFQPLRDRLQKGVNRFMFGERDDPYKVLSQLGQQLQTTDTPQATLQSLVQTIAGTLKLPYVAIELAGEEGRLNGASTGKAAAETAELPLRYHNETVGYLLASPRAPGESFTEREHQLLAGIAGQAGAVAYSVRLTTALQHSREKLILAREEERRRIRRDLHDELGPTLASQTFALDTALDFLETNPGETARLLHDLKAQNQETVAAIRQLVYKLRPPALDELGLVGALQAQAGRLTSRDNLQIHISSFPDPLPLLSAAVDVAAYRITLEAMTNVARHSGASRCEVVLQVKENGRPFLRIDVTDNGSGMPPHSRPGVGLNSMGERAEELGGAFEIRSTGSGGTQITALLPL